MNRTLKVTRLHLNKLGTVLLTPLSILATVMVLSIIISLALQRAGMSPSDPSFAENARYNAGVAWSLPGFLIYYGVQAVSTTYPFALALGTTRRNFILGTFLANTLQAAYISLVLLALLGLELATGHWFTSSYVLDTYVMGSGNPLVLLATSFIGVLGCLTIGGVFGAIWVRFGSKGPAILGLALGLIVAVGVLLAAPYLGEIIPSITGGAIALAAAVIIAISLVATWFAMRRASVR